MSWNGILKILEISHLAKDGSCLYKEENLKNTIHATGEELILKVLFAGQAVPANYYVGLDSRTAIGKSQTINDIFGWEPLSNSYSRQSIVSNNFSIVTSSTGRQANSPILLFRASGGSWGPVKNIFLTTALGFGANSVLISSVPLSTSITVADGEIVTMKMAMALSSC